MIDPVGAVPAQSQANLSVRDTDQAVTVEMQVLWRRDEDPGNPDSYIQNMQGKRWGGAIGYVALLTSIAVLFSVRLVLRVVLVCKI